MESSNKVMWLHYITIVNNKFHIDSTVGGRVISLNLYAGTFEPLEYYSKFVNDIETKNIIIAPFKKLMILDIPIVSSKINK